MSTDPTYVLGTFEGQPFIRCLLCGLRSFLPSDLTHHYCGRCHLSHELVRDMRTLHADGFTHECAEWTTARDICAVCGAPSRWLAGR